MRVGVCRCIAAVLGVGLRTQAMNSEPFIAYAELPSTVRGNRYNVDNSVYDSMSCIISCNTSRSNGLARIGAVRVIGLSVSRISCG